MTGRGWASSMPVAGGPSGAGADRTVQIAGDGPGNLLNPAPCAAKVPRRSGARLPAKGSPTVRKTFFSRPAVDSSSPALAALATPLAALVMLLAANCGGGSGQSNPPPPDIDIETNGDIQDVGERFVLDASGTTDPNGDAEDLTFQWRITDGGTDETDFEDHCRDDFDEICDSNEDDFCSNDEDRFCDSNDDCINFGICQLNSGTESEDCTTGICGLGEGDEGPVATFVANTAGPFSVRLTAIGSESNAARTILLQTYPSLYVTGTILQFGGTEGAFLGKVADADDFAQGASEGTTDPNTGNIVVIDSDINLVRTFDLHTGEILETFGETDRFVDVPTAITFNQDNGRLYVGDLLGDVRMFDGKSGLLVSKFANVGFAPIAMRFSPVSGELYVVSGVGGTGIRHFSANGDNLGVLGETASALDEPVDFDFLPEDEDHDLVIADRTGKVVRCDVDGDDCRQFSAEADNLLAAGSPSGIAVSPSAPYTDNDVMIADPVGQRVITCSSDGDDCSTFGETEGADSDFSDVFFAPFATPTTTTTSSTTTTLEP